MTFEVGVVATFRAEHHLVGDFGPAAQVHGHVYRVEASVRGDQLRADGTLFDISRLQDALAAAVGELDNRDLNVFEALARSNPTAEVVARYLFERIAAVLVEPGLGWLETRVWESPEAYASYAAELA